MKKAPTVAVTCWPALREATAAAGRAALLVALTMGFAAAAPRPRPTAALEPGADSAGVPAGVGSALPREQAQAALDFHNEVRREVGVPPLRWSTALAAEAQRWAQQLADRRQCRLEHTPNNRHGENLFGGRGREYTALDASQRWYSEVDQYHHGPLAADDVHAVGHYTQMVWRSTTQIGIGIARCASGALVIVAEYDPPGNFLGDAPY